MNQPFMKLPNRVLIREDITPTEKLVYGYLYTTVTTSCCNSCNFCNAYIAEKLGLERNTVKPALSALKKAGLINITFIRCLEFHDMKSIRCIELLDVEIDENAIKPLVY